MRKLVVLGISGSPRKGNSQFLLDKALEAARNVDPDGLECVSYSIRGKKIGPCMSCFRCGKQEGECIIKDDFQELFELWLKADVIIYSVPVYHMGIPGQLKCFIDRLGNSLFGKYQGIFQPGEGKLPKLLKIIGSIVQGVHLCAGQEHTLTSLINHTLIMQCIPVTGDMWHSYIGGGGWTSNDLDPKALEKQLTENNCDALIAVKSAQDIGKRAAELALLIRAGGYSRKMDLHQDPIYKPFLARIG